MNLPQINQAAISQWLKLRKKTTVVHLIYGALCAGFSAEYFPAGVLLLLVFAGFEAWNDHCNGTKEGCDDWWEAFLIFSIGLTVLLILQFIGKCSIRWY